MSYEGYCETDLIRARLLLPADTGEGDPYQADLEYAGTEASRMIDEKIRPYKSLEGTEESKEPFVFTTLPLTAEIIPDILKEVCADIGAGLFKRRQKPEAFDQGWLNQGLTKLQDFIKANWFKGSFAFSTTEAEEEIQIGWMEQLFNLLAQIKGEGWTDETLKAIKDLLDVLDISGLPALVWAYTTRKLTNLDDTRATKIDYLTGNVALDSTVAKDATVAKDSTVAKEATLTGKSSQASVNRKVSFMDFWDLPSPQISITNAETNINLNNVVVAGIPDGASILRVVALLKIAVIRDSSGGNNKTKDDDADFYLKVDATENYPSTVNAMYIPDDSWAVDTSISKDRGGDARIGTIDIKDEVVGNGTYYFRFENAQADGSNLNLEDVMVGVRIYFI